MIRVKITGSDFPLMRQLPAKMGIWEDAEFIHNDPTVRECDYWFIFDSDGLEHDGIAVCPRSHIFFVMGEAEGIHIYNKKFVQQFTNLITVQKIDYGVSNTYYDYFSPWFVGIDFGKENISVDTCSCSYDDLTAMEEIPKSKLISVISSNKTMSKGHCQRLKFVKKLKEHFGDSIDVYGRGIRDFGDKWSVLAPYKYHIAIENQMSDDYITEKLLDPFLAMSYPIYYGAPNVGEYFETGAYTSIDIGQPDKAINTIEQILQEDAYEKKLNAIKRVREKILNEYNIFAKMVKIVNQNKNNDIAVENIIYPEYRFGFKNAIKRKLLFWRR